MRKEHLVPTGEATIGPFFPPRYVDAGASDLTLFEGRRAKGEVIEIRGRVVQEDGAPLENVILEIWQADAAGIFRHPADPRHAQADIATANDQDPLATKARGQGAQRCLV